MNIKKIYWLVFFAMIGVYALMLFWSLPKIIADDGIMLFDLRPKGYSFEEAQQILNSLSPQAIEFYKNIQASILDMIFPALLFLTLALAYWLLAPTNWGRWRFLILLFALPGTIFDYLENFTIIKMLDLGAQNINADIVKYASTYTIYKSASVTLSLFVLLALIGIFAYQKYRAKNNNIY